MLIFEIWKVALTAVRANKLRSFLTMLGIIIGVGAVITMIALGSGAQKAVTDQISALGTNLLTVMPGQSFMRGVVYLDDRREIRAFHSDDGRTSWTATVRVADVQYHRVAGKLRSDPLPSAQIDPSGQIFVVWPDCRFWKMARI